MEKGIIIPIYNPDGEWIGNIVVNEKLEVTNCLKYGYKIKNEAYKPKFNEIDGGREWELKNIYSDKAKKIKNFIYNKAL